MDRGSGVRARGTGIQIDFIYRGVRCRETLKIPPTKANLTHAAKKRNAILYDIERGDFDYLKHFPTSRKAKHFTASYKQTVADALDDFLKAHKKKVEYSTWRDYKSAVDFHLKPQFGKTPLGALSAVDVKAWIGGLAITAKRINNVLIPLRAITGDAFADGILDRNPMVRVKNLSHPTEEPEPFTPEERELILSNLPEQSRNLFQFAFWTGLRTSELIALEWGDVDWLRGSVRVRRASVRKRVKRPKTASGERDVKLLSPALEALNAQKAFTLLVGERIFHNPRTKSPWETDQQLRMGAWTPALKKAKVRYRNPYQTRHTYASTLLSAGENPLWVAQQMGHKDWGMIRKRYGRWIPQVDDTAGAKVMAIWSQLSHKEAASG
jgi:integrase